MTPQEAIALLDRAVSAMTLTRADHIKLIEAVKILQTELAKKKEN